jgi:DNA replication protein DnaC
MSVDGGQVCELGYPSFSWPGRQLLCHPIGKLYQNSWLLITTTLTFTDWPHVFGDAKMTITILDRPPSPPLSSSGD